VTTWEALLVAATGLHLGFQAAVTVLVYPALARAAEDDWHDTHALHSRRITPLVVVVYAAALVACVGSAYTDPRSAGVWVAVLGTALAFVVTALAAAPAHGRLGAGRDQVQLNRLLRADRFRLAGAALALTGALTWALAA